MMGLPNIGQRVRIWPAPGRKAHESSRPVDAEGGGKFVPSEGREVIWSEFHSEQLRFGEITLHNPSPAAPAIPAAAVPVLTVPNLRG